MIALNDLVVRMVGQPARSKRCDFYRSTSLHSTASAGGEGMSEFVTKPTGILVKRKPQSGNKKWW